tara:strand:- start:388 stop:1167 length:780 start_codon:yes stop_codon:yes gene_type:complete
MVLWSHRCYHSEYGDNSIAGCKQAVWNGFTGIEVDVQYHEGQFYLHHDHWYLSTETLEQLLTLNLSADMWIDLKTCDLNGVNKLLDLVSDFPHRLIVEVRDQKLVLPLENANITVAGLGSFNSVKGWDYILYGLKKPCATWNLDMLCFNDMFFADGGEIAITRFKKPWHCDIYFPGRLWLWAFVIIILLALIYLAYIVTRQLRRHCCAIEHNKYMPLTKVCRKQKTYERPCFTIDFDMQSTTLKQQCSNPACASSSNRV